MSSADDTKSDDQKSESGSSKREVRIEGRESKEHEHKDGSKGTDTYAAKVIYEDGKEVHQSDAGFGHISTDKDTGEQKDHVK